MLSIMQSFVLLKVIISYYENLLCLTDQNKPFLYIYLRKSENYKEKHKNLKGYE